MVLLYNELHTEEKQNELLTKYYILFQYVMSGSEYEWDLIRLRQKLTLITNSMHFWKYKGSHFASGNI